MYLKDGVWTNNLNQTKNVRYINLDSSFYRYDLDGTFYPNDLGGYFYLLEHEYFKQDDKLKPIFDMILSQLFGSISPSYQDIVDFFHKKLKKVSTVKQIYLGPSVNSFSTYVKAYKQFVKNNDDGIYILCAGQFDAYDISHSIKFKEIKDRAFYEQYSFTDFGRIVKYKILCEHLDYYKILYFKNQDGRKVSFEQFLTLLMTNRGYWNNLMISNKTGKILYGIGEHTGNLWCALDYKIDFSTINSFVGENK